MRKSLLILPLIAFCFLNRSAYGQLEFSGHSESADGFTSTDTYRSDLKGDGNKVEIQVVDHCSGCSCPEIRIGSQVFEVPRDCYPIDLVEGPNNSISIIRRAKSKIVGRIWFEPKKKALVVDW